MPETAEIRGDLTGSVSFSCRSARSPAIVWTLGALIVLETAALHLLFVRRVPLVAWSLTAASLWALVWLWSDDRALRRADAVRVDATHLRCDVGKRLAAVFPRSAVREVLTPTWRDLAGGAPRPFNATRPAPPNVLIVFDAPQKARVLGGLTRDIDRLALHVETPEKLVALLSGKP